MKIKYILFFVLAFAVTAAWSHFSDTARPARTVQAKSEENSISPYFHFREAMQQKLNGIPSYVRNDNIPSSMKLERNYSKDAILAAYLNTAYFGADAYGISKACRIYYGISPESLTLAQSAMLAGLVQAPTYYNPFENYEAAKSRQKLVLDRMAEQELITKAQADKAYAEDLHLQKKGKT